MHRLLDHPRSRRAGHAEKARSRRRAWHWLQRLEEVPARLEGLTRLEGLARLGQRLTESTLYRLSERRRCAGLSECVRERIHLRLIADVTRVGDDFRLRGRLGNLWHA